MARTRAFSTISLTALAFLTMPLLGAPPAQGATYYASPAGNDGNDCLAPQTPCRSAQAAIVKMPLGIHTLSLSPGLYDEGLEVVHGKQVFIYGPLDANGCPNANAVTVRRFSVQDNATIWVSCLTTGTIGCRQYSIVDVANIVFDGTAGVALVANETCRINANAVGSLWINGQLSAFAVAQNYSTIYLSGRIEVSQQNLTMSYFLRAVDSTLDLSGATFSGYPLAGGLRFTLDHGIIAFPLAGSESIPGSGSQSVNMSICRPCN